LRGSFPEAIVRRMGKVRRALATDDETRWELRAVAIVLALMGLIALILIGLWLGGVWTGLIIVGVPLTTITALFIWGNRSAQASDRDEAQELSPTASSETTGRSPGP
jgi:hypothetical protein